MKAYRFLPALLVTAFLLHGCGGPDNSANGFPAPVLADTPAEPLNLLVIGGTSGIGLETVRLGLERGHRVTAMARRPERMPISDSNVILFKGDVTDPYSVDAAVEGQDAVIFTIGIGPTREPVTVFSEGTENVLDSMQRFGVNELVMVTGIGAGDSRGHGSFFYDFVVRPFMMNTVYEDKDRSEALVVESASNWVIVRPGFLTDDEAGLDYRVIREMDGVTAGDIARADVAHFMIWALESEELWGETVLLTE